MLPAIVANVLPTASRLDLSTSRKVCIHDLNAAYHHCDASCCSRLVLASNNVRLRNTFPLSFNFTTRTFNRTVPRCVFKPSSRVAVQSSVTAASVARDVDDVILRDRARKCKTHGKILQLAFRLTAAICLSCCRATRRMWRRLSTAFFFLVHVAVTIRSDVDSAMAFTSVIAPVTCHISITYGN